jgi:hypothetical protein
MELQYPLISGFRELVEGNGFLADVVGTGRVLAVEEGPKSWWIYGVNPGGLASSGESMREAHLLFLQELKKVLFDFAAEAGSFEQFKSAVEDFFNATNEPTLADWNAAVTAVRSGKVTCDLPRAKAESPFHVTVAKRQTFTPQKNIIQEAPRVAA